MKPVTEAKKIIKTVVKKNGATAASSPTPAPEVTIEAKVDVGFGNAVFLRGQGGGLSWERGVPLKCVDGSTWRWSTKADDKLTFKLLLNDAVWAQGADVTAVPGQILQIAPRF
jgi:hypothetical protein